MARICLRSRSLLAVLFSIAAAQAFAQSGNTLRFEVASIRADKSDGPPILRPLPDGIRATRVTLHMLLCNAYGLCATREDPIAGEPAWAQTETYTVEAKVDSATVEALNRLPPDQRAHELDRMLQPFLADRCKLRAHTETRQLPAYNLVLAGKSPRLTPSRADTPDLPNGLLRIAPGHITAQNVSLHRLAQMLTPQVSHPVTDRSGLTGRYDFTLDWTSDTAVPTGQAESVSPALFTALKEQLGLKLEPTKLPGEVLIVDHLERPSEN